MPWAGERGWLFGREIKRKSLEKVVQASYPLLETHIKPSLGENTEEGSYMKG